MINNRKITMEENKKSSNRNIGTGFLTQSMFAGQNLDTKPLNKHKRNTSTLDSDGVESNPKKDSNLKSGKLRSSMYGSKNTTKTFYKTKEVKMEKFLDKKQDNLILYYKNGKKLFEGTITTTIEEGSWYYPNGHVYYCGPFNKQGYPEGEKCIFYYENGQRKFVGKIEKQKVDVYIPYQQRKDSDSLSDQASDKQIKCVKKNKAKKEEVEKSYFKIHTGCVSIAQLTKNEYIEIPTGKMSFVWKRNHVTNSRFVKDYFEDYDEFLFEGSVINGYLEGEGCLYYVENEVTESIVKSKIELRTRTQSRFSSPRLICQKDKISNSASSKKNSEQNSPTRVDKNQTITPIPLLESNQKTPEGFINTKTINLEKGHDYYSEGNNKNLVIHNINLNDPKNISNHPSTLDNVKGYSVNENLIKISEVGNTPAPGVFFGNGTPTPTITVSKIDAEQDLREKYSPNGYQFYKGNFIKGKMDGPCKFYDIGITEEDEENVPIFTGQMTEGLLTGFGVLNYLSGKKFQQGVWLNDVQNGKRNFGFYETGAKYFEGEFDKEGGKNVTIYTANGRTVQYKGTTYPINYLMNKIDWKTGKTYDRGTGKVRCDGHWLNGRFHGENIKMYNSAGVLQTIGHYREAIPYFSKEYNLEGKLRVEAYLEKNRYCGLVKKYGPKEELVFEGNFQNGLREGQGTEYWEVSQTNGKENVKKVQGTFYKNKLHGFDIKLYNKKGIIAFEGSFSEDRREGYGMIYHPNGILEMAGKFKLDKLTDPYVRVFSTEGFPLYEGGYHNGYRRGFGKMYDLRGKLKAVGLFEGSHCVDERKPFFTKDHVGMFKKIMGVNMK